MQDVNTLKATTAVPEFLVGGGEMGERMREFDWSSTSLGPVSEWPRSLRTCVQIMLTSRQPIWIGWGKDLIKIYNDPYKTIAGGKHPWALGKPASVVWKDIWKEIDPMLRQVMLQNEGTYVESQLLIMERNGYPEETYYTFSYTPVAGDNGITEGMICVNTDDTDRIITERQLMTITKLGKVLNDAKMNDEVFRKSVLTFAENPQDFPFALFYQNVNGALVLSAATELGESQNSVPQNISDNSGGIAEICFTALSQRRPMVVEDLVSYFGEMPKGAWSISPKKAIILPIAQRGVKVPYALLIVGLNPYRLLEGKYASFYDLVADQISTSVSNVHAIDEERKRIEALAEIDRAKTTFFSNISHEFRTPLTLLLGPMEDLLGETSLDSHAKEKVSVAFRNALRMQKLVNLLLDFSRIEAGRMEAQFTPVDIARLTSDLASNFRSAIEKAGMDLIVDLEPLSDPVYVDVDMYEKIILNLISNAFKYSEKGSIRIRSKVNADNIEISVADTGMGIPPEELNRIFERFHRVQNAKGRSQEGTGIGLAMVRELVKMHEGTIAVTSTPGKGSVFTVTLPLGSDHLQGRVILENASFGLKQSHLAYIEEANQWGRITSNGDATSLGDHSKQVSRTKKGKVLLADDNADMQVFVKRLLENDFDVITASDGEEALDKALKEAPDLILSDVMMPRMDGFAFLERVKQNMATRNIPFIFLSARAGEEAKVDGLRAGADDYLTKPFSSKELLARVSGQISISYIRRKTEKEFFNLFVQSPVHIHVMKGPEHVLEFFHPLAIRFVGRDITGLKIREALPFLEGQGYFEMLDRVYNEGVTLYLNESKATLPSADGTVEDHYFNITYLPWRDVEGNIQGVLQSSFEVTETVKLRLQAEANERKFREIARQAPVSMTLLLGREYRIAVANEKVLQLWGRSLDDVIERPVMEVFPELKEQGFQQILDKVYETGEPFVASEMPVTFMQGDTERSGLINLLYQPFQNANGEIEGIVAVGTEVTEQVEARRRVAEAELRSRTIIEQTPSLLCIFKGKEMVLEVANEAALSVWNMGPEVIGKKITDIMPDAAREGVLDTMLEVFTNGVTRQTYESPAFRMRDDVDQRYFNFCYVPFYNPLKEITGVLVLATDVTEQVLAKKALVDNEERLRISTEILELGTWEYDVKAHEFYLSERTQKLFGLNAEQVPLQTMADNIIAPDRERFVSLLRGAAGKDNDGKFDHEFTIGNERAGEDPRIMRSIAQCFFDDEGSPTRMVGTALDITERKSAEQKIIASELRFRLLTSSIPQIVWTYDVTGRTTFISDQFRIYTELSVEEASASWENLVHPDDYSRFLSKRMDAIQKGDAWYDEFRLRDGKGIFRWFLANGKPLKDATGNVIMYVGAASDIQDLKEQSAWLEEQVHERTRTLKELNRSLKMSNEDLQQFAHVASHDLKEPIRKIKTYSNRLKDEFGNSLPERGSNFLNKILSATDRMYTMIDGVLSYSMFAAAEEPVEKVDLSLVLHQIQNDLEVLINEKSATIRTHGLPEINGASVLLYQLFYNLINNSLKFTRPGVPPEITLECTTLQLENNDFYKITLRDNGIGFEPEQAEKIFTTFTRLNSKDKYEGTGLGLALCKKIVQRHGGFISAHGSPDWGAEFIVLLPAIV